FTPNGQRVVTGSSDNRLKFWDLSGRETASYDLRIGIFSIAYSPDGSRLLIGTGDNTFPLGSRLMVGMYSAETLQPLLYIGQESSPAFYVSVAYSFVGDKILTGRASGGWVAPTFGGICKLWDGKTGAELFTLVDNSERHDED